MILNDSTSAPLHEDCRPVDFDGVVAQDKAITRIQRVAKRRGYGGKAFWLQGKSGTGKTTIAKIIASKITDGWGVEELNAIRLTPAKLEEWERKSQTRSIGGGWALIINEAHAMSKACVQTLLDILERIPGHVVWIFTTTHDGAGDLFEDNHDAAPLLSRCCKVELSSRDLTKPFAKRAVSEAMRLELCDLDEPAALKKCERALKDNRNNLRALLQEIEGGLLFDD